MMNVPLFSQFSSRAPAIYLVVCTIHATIYLLGYYGLEWPILISRSLWSFDFFDIDLIVYKCLSNEIPLAIEGAVSRREIVSRVYTVNLVFLVIFMIIVALSSKKKDIEAIEEAEKEHGKLKLDGKAALGLSCIMLIIFICHGFVEETKPGISMSMRDDDIALYSQIFFGWGAMTLLRTSIAFRINRSK